ncbi:MAG: hypothetical protein ACSHX6_01785 [Akkermansiaceae bacterium]
MSRKVIIIILTVVFAVGMGYFSKPDRGGVERCSFLFSMPELKHLELEHVPVSTWELFETPKFQLKIGEGDYERLAELLAKDGYSTWEHGSLLVGSFYLGGSMEDDFIYCSKRTPSWNYYWSYSAREGMIYAVISRA